MGGKILGFSGFFGKILRHISFFEWFWQKLLYQFMLLTYMAEILVYKTAEEAKKQLEKYERDNREAFEEFEKSFGEGEDRSERLKKQRYFLVAELSAYVDDGPGRYYYESQHFPFLGWTELYDDIPSLAQGVKNAVKHQTPQNIEPVLYTVRNHDAENKEMKKLTYAIMSVISFPSGVIFILQPNSAPFSYFLGPVAGWSMKNRSIAAGYI